MNKPTLLLLEDETVFHGISIGTNDCSVSEVVFNTSLPSYQEILSHLAYAWQIISITYPHLDNVSTQINHN